MANTSELRLSFLGGASNVTGSQYFLEANGVRLLVDCGLYQERELLNRNWEPFAIPPSSLHALLLTHAHIDHCGLIPKLVREGFRGKIYCTEATAEITKIVLLDAAHLQEEDAEFKRKRHEREGRKGAHPEVPLYTTADAEASFTFFKAVEYEKPVNLGDGVSTTFHDAGHVLGSSMITVNTESQGWSRTVLFTGDIGRPERPILNDPHIFKEVDYIIMESTYGDRVHEESTDISGRIADVINYTWEKGGNIIVPSFALQRSQEILFRMNELLRANRIPHILVFLDSPMAAGITKVYEKHSELFDQDMQRYMKKNPTPFSFSGLKITQSADESKALNHIKGTIMIIAGSGMCTGGRIKHHLVTNISRPESTILFTGYQAIGTLGRQIIDGAKKVRILGQEYPVRARIVQLQGSSGHADRNELLQWVSHLERAPRRVFVTHGDSDASHEFARLLHSKTGWQVSTPGYGEKTTLD